jgi:hypothetical protein
MADIATSTGRSLVKGQLGAHATLFGPVGVVQAFQARCDHMRRRSG